MAELNIQQKKYRLKTLHLTNKTMQTTTQTMQPTTPTCDLCDDLGFLAIDAHQSGGEIVDEVRITCLCRKEARFEENLEN